MSRWSIRLLKGVLVVVVLVAPLVTGLNFINHAGLRDHLDVFSAILVSPTALVLPLIAVVVSCLELYNELGNRFVASTRSRISIREKLAMGALAAAATSFALFFAYAFIPFLIAFVLWPAIGDPNIDPAGYHMTPTEAHIDALSRNSYSFLLGLGDFPYGIIYSLWVGLCGATFALLGYAFLLMVPNRIFALSLPFLIYVGGTVAAAVLGSPGSGFLYAIFPSGLQAAPLLQVATPMASLSLAAFLLVAFVIFRSPTNPRLS